MTYPSPSTLEHAGKDFHRPHYINLPQRDCTRSAKLFQELYDASYRYDSSLNLDKSHSFYHTHWFSDGYFVPRDISALRFDKTQSTIFTVLELLYREIEKLQTELNSIHESVKQLVASHSPLQSSIDKFSKKLADMTDSSSIKAPAKEVTNSPSDHSRKRQVFLRNLSLSEDDPTSIKNLCKEIHSPIPLTSFRLKGPGIRPLILTFPTAEEAVQFIRSLSRSKREGSHPLLIARPNYSVEDEKVYKSSWAEACAKNDQAGEMIYVVKNLQVIRLEKPECWRRKERPNRE
ncbi:hypothetical protein DXG03_003050 [Asterophora parasitica]|uniref:Uncharacterized protein n=1 Tax=Asterophora parasitica TaxID=117018 RepID=A0A9P7FWB9_9AGAR|nr:hypothetical protein DXG03_003050 [Asterophora parasitica]